MSDRASGRRFIPGSEPFAPSEALEHELEHLLEELPNKRAASVPLLLHIQEEYGLVSPEAEEWVSEKLEMPPVKVRELTTFYGMLKQRPVGRHHLRVCRNLSCTLMGGEELIDHIGARMGCEAGRRTPDGEVSWELVECLGACELAPMLQWNEDYHGPLDLEGFDELYRRHLENGSGGESPDPGTDAATADDDGNTPKA